ncbi:phosphoribosyl transferase [Nostoc linckia z18]|uniref:Phosphoribosyl transferase n=2 Tax=Nostoc linckia TaxID=92942 RepID=A0A9Q5ZD99_NOSLI|nr:phosphoribosyltransferase [Nostoc linckia]PHK38814.1 phosphoribosyl transferase [Nostoc linckia z16]PHJ53551.1 phosphoribosyl transferase [Nostoc linckia z1]PHJ56262.1 phosphoribosyl transferase [Nostoc linckia z3]PHJ69703.1 phosphoribosyl transferase [Nostoc linckia z2]PHJ79397.1 phosphoribosyl transferase [Nostoc linckia z4]
MLFKNRRFAGQVLAQELAAYVNRSDVVVLGLPRGGVPVAFEVAQALNAPLDVLVVRKLGVPDREELAMGAIAPGGVRILNTNIINMVNISDEVIARVAVQEERELQRRENLYRGQRPFPDLHGRTVILVDDGLATGATMWAAVVAVRKHQPAAIVIAVPVAAAETCQQLETEVDQIACVSSPSPFYSVGLWYENFPQTTDEEVRELLTTATKNGQALFTG